MIAVQDGSTRSNLTEVLVELNRATTDKSLYEGDIDTTINTLDIAAGINDSSSAEERATRTSVSTVKMQCQILYNYSLN